MLSPQTISEQLEAVADEGYARRVSRHISPLKGLRGVPSRDVVAVLVSAWKNNGVKLPRDNEGLIQLFRTAHEDGLVAIGLAAAALPDSPDAALDLAEGWMEVADDLDTADAIGWLLLGPGLLASGEPFVAHLTELLSEASPIRRRTAVIALMAALPIPIEGPSAAALRARLKQKRVAFVEEPIDALLQGVLPRAMKDSDPHVRKAVARVMRTWAVSCPDAVEAIMAEQPGGVSRYIREEAEKGIRKGRRKQ
ncbi:MAG: hypothetical protein ACI8RZ_002883 [Myxococcota bacterium]|jgi:hypothetical protein